MYNNMGHANLCPCALRAQVKKLKKEIINKFCIENINY